MIKCYSKIKKTEVDLYTNIYMYTKQSSRPTAKCKEATEQKDRK